MKHKTTNFSGRITCPTLLLIGLLVYCSCEKKSVTPSSLSQPSTYFKVNQYTCLSDSAVYRGTSLKLYGSYGNINAHLWAEDVSIYANVNDTGTYKLGAKSSGGYATYYYYFWEGPPELYTTDSSHTGILTISQYDAVAKLITGTYSFTVNPSGNISGSFHLNWQ